MTILSFRENLNKKIYRLTRRLDLTASSVVTLHPDDIPEQYTSLPTNFCGRALSGEALYKVAGQLPGVDKNFVTRAIKLNNWCYAIFAGDQVASAGWYAPSTPVSETVARFSSDYCYMYRGFTHQDFRGHRLHGFGLTHACAIAVNHGAKKGLISLIEYQNHQSKRSIERLGFKFQATLVSHKEGIHRRSIHSPSCKRLGFELIAADTRTDTLF